MQCCGLDLPTERFPTACREGIGDRKRCWRGLYERWRKLPAGPLRVRGQLANGFVPSLDGALHLDGILSAACMSLYASVVGDRVDPYVVPLPLGLSWVSRTGMPLWTATDLVPTDEAARGVTYLHARYPVHRADIAVKQSVLTSAGRYKDARIPMLVIAAAEVVGVCFGDREWVSKLLDLVTHVGKKGSHGHGRVLSWSVGPAEGVVEADVLDRRPVPIEFLADRDETIEAARIAPRRGWSPPYWHAPSHSPVRLPRWTI